MKQLRQDSTAWSVSVWRGRGQAGQLNALASVLVSFFVFVFKFDLKKSGLKKSGLSGRAFAFLLGAFCAAIAFHHYADNFAPARAQETESTLRVIAHADLRSLDPIWTTAYISRNHGYLVYDTLFAMDANWQPQPQMVEAWEVSEDKLTWTFHLRAGLLWHDATAVTAQDCVASLKRWGKRDNLGQQLFDRVASVQALDEDSFRLVLSEPFGLLLESLAKISSNVPFMMPARIAATSPDEPIEEAIGSGPYRFLDSEWTPGVRAVYERNESYLPRDEPPSNAAGGKQAYFQRIEWHYVPDPNTALNGLLNNEYDLWEQVPSDFARRLERHDSLEMTVPDQLGYQGMLRFNHLHPPFNDRFARRAALHAIKQSDSLIAAAGNRKFWRTCASYFPCDTPLASAAAIEHVEYNPARARELLDESEYDGEEIVLLHPSDIPQLSAFAQVAAEELRDVGFKVKLETLDWAAVTERRASKAAPEDGGWHLFPTAWLAVDVLNPALAAPLNASGADAWFGWPEDAKLETARAEFLVAQTDKEKKRAAEKVQERAIRHATHINLGMYFIPMVARKGSFTDWVESSVPFFWGVKPAP